MNGCIQVCGCTYSMNNTGVNGCNPLIHVTRKVILVPKFDSTGARNSISLTATLNQAFFTALVNQADSTKRWFPLPNLVDVGDKRADAITQKFSDQRTAYVADGLRTFEGMIWGKKGSPLLKGKIDSARCNEMSAYLIDKQGNLTGGSTNDDDTLLYPYDMDSESIVAQMVFATDTTLMGIKIMFNFDPDQSDACIRMIKADEMGGAKLLQLDGLRDVFATFSSLATTGAVADLFIDGVNPKTRLPVTGMLVADFISSSTGTASKVRNLTDSADVAITSVTESGTIPGRYTFVWGAQTSADQVAIKGKLTGFDFTNVANDPIAIP